MNFQFYFIKYSWVFLSNIRIMIIYKCQRNFVEGDCNLFTLFLLSIPFKFRIWIECVIFLKSKSNKRSFLVAYVIIIYRPFLHTSLFFGVTFGVLLRHKIIMNGFFTKKKINKKYVFNFSLLFQVSCLFSPTNRVSKA